jgi:tetratricopeptide (TPR) repeat protein
MKTQIIFPVLFAIAAGITPLKAGVVSEDPTKADELTKRAGAIIIYNTDNKDSLHFAISLCDQAIQMDAENVTAHFNRGYAALMLENYTEALKDFDFAVEKEGDAYDYEFRGETKFQMNDLDGALADYKSAGNKGIGNAEGSAHLAMGDANALGIAYYNAEKYDKAIDAFTVSVDAQLTQNNIFNRANAEYLNGDKEMALQDWKKSGKLGNKEGKKSYKKFK